MIIIRKVFTIILVLLVSSWITAAETHTNSNDDNSEGVTKTVIDILSENVQFSTFLRLLQRNQLIPFLNELTNITLVAPVNSAFALDHHNNKSNVKFGNNDKNAEIEHFSLNELKKYIITEPVISGDFIGSNIFNTYYNNVSPILVKSNKSDDQFEINGINVVEPDFLAESQDSVVQGIENLFYNSIPTTKLLSKLNNTLISQELINSQQKNDFFNKTLLIPTDDSFNFKDYHINYLKSEFGEKDSNFLFNSLSIEGIYGGDLNNSLKDGNNFQILFSSNDSGNHIIINNTISSFKSNILTEDSILHLFDNTNLIPNIEFNPLKIIVGLNSSGLVDELILQKLDYLITNNSIKQTIFIPSQDYNQFYITSKNSNLYHFIDEKIENLSENLNSKNLFNSKFCSSKKLGSSCQKIKIQEKKPGNFTLNDNFIIIDGPYKIGETIIYITDEDLRTPNDLRTSLNPMHHCSKSLKHMENLGLLKLSNNNLGYTYFLPCYDSWDNFELTSSYFEKNSTALEILMKNFILNGLFYTDIGNFESIEYKNLNGEKINLENDDYNNDKSKDLHLKYNKFPINLKKNDDVLYNQGVIHPIEKIIFPSGLDITLKDIIESSDVGLFVHLIDTIPEIDFNDVLKSQNYSILLPSLKSLEKNLPFESNTTLGNFLKLHIIKPSSLENLYSCSGDIETLLGVNLTCSRISGSKGDFFLQINEESDNGVRVLNKGCTNSENHNCVFAIDRPIALKWLDDHDHYHLTIPGVALAIGVLVGVVVMVFTFVCLMLFVARRKDSFIFHNEERSSPDENSPLLNESGNDIGDNRTNNTQSSSSFGQNYSSNAAITPIRMSNPINREPNMN
ncbi:FAS1 domain-containing protein [Wickerhamomyces ciferrii]|uniref:FAS1 domain-containing protein n=1 Tax=Wickerhamomyces ciferrii (strain ATCC 14091 / BCRC 22168 / CBS 111 / JCM 3599 / NBRC 0793 / NRRL Y-1031 F-60-10) TaxID=1206466 RepID=K0KHG5_WICCF|nr:FAS1 domain-containing protein [Wickerhamomyces ciferrii]CCH44660.1 FAS1 domain-containing protein [Wickerhamomyces ciferrii]